MSTFFYSFFPAFSFLSSVVKMQSGYCVELTPNAAIESLKEYVRNKSSQPKGVLVDECFFNKHPEDVLNEPGNSFGKSLG